MVLKYANTFYPTRYIYWVETDKERQLYIVSVSNRYYGNKAQAELTASTEELYSELKEY